MRGKWKLVFFLLGALLVCVAPALGPGAEAAAQTQDDAGTTCTVFLYMCGSNLESRYALATENIEELLAADIPESTTVVLQTGGTSRWWSLEEPIANDRLSRYIVRDHHLELVMDMDNDSMGSASVFGDFLKWGQENYFADRNILVLWDHGGNSAEGVCYDENFGYDCLERRELVESFEQAELPDRFDLICLDTCYMGELLNADLLSDYARYMTASQIIVPGPGMDYQVLAEKAGISDIKELGKLLCDTFLEKCGEKSRADEAQLAFYDLDAARALVGSIDKSTGILRKLYTKVGTGFSLFRWAERAHVMDSGGRSNLIDLMRFVKAMTYVDWSPARRRIQTLLDNMVLYQVSGENVDLCGTSIYYPLYYDEVQLAAYERMSRAPNYCGLLQDVYGELPDELISFKDPGSIDKDGQFHIELTEESRDYIRNIYMRVWQENSLISGSFNLVADSEVETYVTELGRLLSDISVTSSLPTQAYALNGHRLLLSVASTAFLQTCSAPIRVNGEDTRYTFVIVKKPIGDQKKILFTKLGQFIDENGLASRIFGNLKAGDKVIVYSALDETGEMLTYQEEFVVEEDDPSPELIPLEKGKYRCQYIVTDIIGRTYGSAACRYEITEDGRTVIIR